MPWPPVPCLPGVSEVSPWASPPDKDPAGGPGAAGARPAVARRGVVLSNVPSLVIPGRCGRGTVISPRHCQVARDSPRPTLGAATQLAQGQSIARFLL